MHASGERWRLGRRAALAAVLLVGLCSLVASAWPAPSFPADPGHLHKVGVVLSPGPVGSWDDGKVESPSVVRDDTSSRWAMAYTGYDRDGHAQIGLAYSDDGLHWAKTGRPILGPSNVAGAPDRAGATGPVLVQDGARWVLFYIGLTEAGYEAGTKTINYATAKSPAGPWIRHGTVVAPVGDGWRAKAVWHVSVVHAGSSWFMFFNATGADDRETIGYATAPALTGPWTVDDAHSPLLAGRSGSWDSMFVGDPDVRLEGDRWVMRYYGYDGHHAADGIAVTSRSDFPLGWRRAGVELAPSKPYDAKFAHKPWVTTIDAREFHYYTAVSNDDQRTIALAEGPTASG